MTGLAELVAKGITAEAAVEVLAEMSDRDWQEAMDQANDISDLDRATRALDKAAAIAPYRALLTSLRDQWEADRDAQVAKVVTVHGNADA